MTVPNFEMHILLSYQICLDHMCNTPSLFLKQILDVNNISNEFYFSLRCLIIFAEVFKISEANNGIYGICGNKLGEN